MQKIQIQYRHFFGYDLLNFLAGLLTFFKYTHVELVIERNFQTKSYSSTFKEGVRMLPYDRSKMEPGKWKKIDLWVTSQIADEIEYWFRREDGKGYDYQSLPFLTWFGWYISQFPILRLFRKDAPNKYSCVESAMGALYFAFKNGNNPAVSVRESYKIIEKYSEVLNQNLFLNTIEVKKNSYI